jgi:hypothetical protein
MTPKEKLEKNPDPKKYVWRKRGDKYILVDRQIVRWQQRRQRLAALKKAKEQAEAPAQDPRSIFDTKLFSE